MLIALETAGMGTVFPQSPLRPYTVDGAFHVAIAFSNLIPWTSTLSASVGSADVVSALSAMLANTTSFRTVGPRIPIIPYAIYRTIEGVAMLGFVLRTFAMHASKVLVGRRMTVSGMAANSISPRRYTCTCLRAHCPFRPRTIYAIYWAAELVTSCVFSEVTDTFMASI